MRKYENNNAIVLRDGDFIAVAQAMPYAQGRELCIWISTLTGMRAVRACLSGGGRLPSTARANSAALLFGLLRMALAKWAGERLTWDAPDARRARIYAAMLRRARIPFTCVDGFFTL